MQVHTRSMNPMVTSPAIASGVASLRRIPARVAAIAIMSIALLVGFVSGATAIGVYKYGLTGGVLYSSGGWQGGGSTDLYNGDTQNIGVAYVELYRNGVGFVKSNSPGKFLYPGQAAQICIAGNCNSGYSVIGKCRSSNTRAGASCAIG